MNISSGSRTPDSGEIFAYPARRFPALSWYLLAFALLIGPLATSVAGSVYDVDRVVEQGRITGTIETDGTTGVLAAANIIDWNLTVDADGDLAITGQLLGPLSGNNSSITFLGGPPLTATPDALFFDFSIPDLDIFQIATPLSDVVWQLQAHAPIFSDELIREDLRIQTFVVHGSVKQQIATLKATPTASNDTMFFSQFEEPSIYAFTFSDADPAKVVIGDRSSAVIAGLFIDASLQTPTQTVLYLGSNGVFSEIHVNSQGLMESIIESGQSVFFSNYDLSNGTVTLTVKDAEDVELVAPTDIPVNIEKLQQITDAYAIFSTTATGPAETSSSFRYAGILIEGGLCGLRDTAAVFSGDATVPVAVLSCDTFSVSAIAYATANPTAEFFALSFDTIGCAVSRVVDCVPVIFDTLFSATRIGVRSTSDESVFVQQAGPVETITFEELANGSTAPFSINGVGFENVPSVSNDLVGLGHSYWFAGLNGSTAPNFLITNSCMIDSAEIRMRIVFPNDIRAIGFYFSDRFAGPNDLIYYSFHDAAGSLLGLYEQIGGSGDDAGFRGLLVSQGFRSVEIAAGQSDRNACGNWLLDDFRYVVD